MIPAGERVVLVDENQWGPTMFPALDVLPFVERDGQYWGTPSDDESGILELERLRSLGANYLLVGWPGFWLLDYYSGLRDYLQSQYQCMLSNSRLVVYDLRATRAIQGGTASHVVDVDDNNET